MMTEIQILIPCILVRYRILIGLIHVHYFGFDILKVCMKDDTELNYLPCEVNYIFYLLLCIMNMILFPHY